MLHQSSAHQWKRANVEHLSVAGEKLRQFNLCSSALPRESHAQSFVEVQCHGKCRYVVPLSICPWKLGCNFDCFLSEESAKLFVSTSKFLPHKQTHISRSRTLLMSVLLRIKVLAWISKKMIAYRAAVPEQWLKAKKKTSASVWKVKIFRRYLCLW